MTRPATVSRKRSRRQSPWRATPPVFRGNLAASTMVLALGGALTLSIAPDARSAGPLPVPCAGSGACGVNLKPNLPFVQTGAATYSAAGNSGAINQTSNNAILNWQSFNIGAGNAVRFIQPSASSAALNRIWQADPSVIAGSLKANGQIYLINQNGIVFANGAQINVGSLVASSLDISDTLFNNGVLSNLNPAANAAFCAQNGGCGSAGAQYTGGLVRVEAGAQLSADLGGRIMLLAPNVQNNGVISTPDGQTILAAGSKVYLAVTRDNKDTSLRGFLVEVDNGGSAENLNLGRIIADRGNATLVGIAVNQSGKISATTTVNANGSIRLIARDTVQPDIAGLPLGSHTGSVVLGAGSVTEVRPELADGQTITDDQAKSFNPSKVEIVGQTIRFDGGSSVVAPGGNVTVTAQNGQLFQGAGSAAARDVRVYMDAGSSIDVSGSMDVPIAIERNLVQAQLRGTELADSPLQRNGFLSGKTVAVDIRKGTPVANVSGYINQIGRTISERSAAGGSITMKSEGDIVLRQGSSLDVSGGSVHYLDGYLQTTQLAGADGRIYDIGSAPANIIYTGFANTYTKSYGKWGVSETFTAHGKGQFTPGYSEGKDAGTITLVGRGVVLDGELKGNTSPGPNQRFSSTTPNGTTLPLGGKLVLGDASQLGQPTPDYAVPDVIFAASANPLPGSYTSGTAGTPTPVTLNTGIFREGDFTRAEIYSNGRIEVPAGVNIALAPGGSLSLNGRQVDIAADISAPGGSIALTTSLVNGQLLPITVSPGVRLSTSGMWINDSPALGATSTGPVVVNGGAVSMTSASDLTLGAGSIIDVSGGGWVKSDGKLAAGNAGSITLQTGLVGLLPQDRLVSKLTLGGELHGYALGSELPGSSTAGNGGKLTLSTSNVMIGGAPTGAIGELWLDSGFFGVGGFKDYAISGKDGVTVAGGTTILLLASTALINSDFASKSSGTDINAFSQHRILPVEQRAAGSVALAAGSLFNGDVTLGAGSALRVDPGGRVSVTAGRQLTVLGSIDAPAGSIAVSAVSPGDTDSFNSGQSIWLGSSSRLTATGYFKQQLNNTGLRQGDVLAGGNISVTANKGYVVMQQGAVADVSGTSAVLDIKQTAGNQTGYVPTLVAGDAGSIALSTREGMLLEGTLLGAPGPGGNAFGGSLSLGFNYPRDLLGYPSAPRQVVISQSGTSVPAGLTPGQTINGALNGIVSISANTVSGGGFDNFSAQSRDVIAFNGNVNLSARRALAFDAPVLATSGSSTVNLAGASVALGNTDTDRQAMQSTGIDHQLNINGRTTELLGSGALNVNARLIELNGNSAISGFDTVNLTSAGDIRLRGALNGPDALALTGSFSTAANLTLRAAQIYPTTLSQFSLNVQGNPTGTVMILPGGSGTPVYSAAGNLTINAPNIVQDGVLKAPFGQITLNATNSLTLSDGSITSISAQGLTIPFGATQLSGLDYTYALGPNNTLILTSLPDKSVRLNGKSVSIADTATINVAGGGDLYAYEFTPGPGGSKDVLDPAKSPNTFAILPGLQSAFAPYDQHYNLGVSGIKTGDSVYLSRMNGLPAGVYTLLPARYGLLPGAFLVTAKAGTSDLQPGQTTPQLDGSQVIAGYRTAIAGDGSLIRDSRVSGFAVEPGSVARTQSEYSDTFVSKFFAGNPGNLLPGDAGRLAIAAGQSLDLGGNLITDHAAGGRGAALDITAQKIAVVSAGGAAVDPSALQIDADRLARLNAESVLLGGTRSNTLTGTQIIVGADQVTVANTSDHPLSAPEIILAANTQVTVKSGAVVEGMGKALTQTNNYSIGSASVPGNGALLRVAAGPQAALTRTNVDRSTGQLIVESGATVLAQQSVRLDATKDNLFNGTVDLASGGALALGAKRISVGETAGVVDGLVFANAQLAALGNPSQLALKSYSTLDLYGTVALGDPTLGSLTLDAAGIGGYLNGGKTATLTAQTVSFANVDSSAFVNAPALSAGAVPALGSGALRVNAQQVTLGNGRFAIKGFSNTNVAAAREIVGTGTGTLSADANLNLQAARITVGAGAQTTIVSTSGALTLTQPATLATDLAPAAIGGQLTITGQSINDAGRIDLPSGTLTLHATAGDIALGTGAQISAGGVTKTYFDTSAAAPAGRVTLTADIGGVTVARGATIDVSGADGGASGVLSVNAINGTAQFAGTLKGGANALAGQDLPRQGEFDLDVKTLANFSALSAQLNPGVDGNGRIVTGGFTDTRNLRIRSGDVTIGSSTDSTTTVKAKNFHLAVDDGNMDVYGAIDASGGKGGSISLLAGKTVTAGAGKITVHDGALLNASATDVVTTSLGSDGQGGSVFLSTAASGGQLNVQSGATINVSGAGVATGGDLLLRTPRNAAGNDVPIIVQGTIQGARQVVAEGYKVYNASTISGTGATDGVSFSASTSATPFAEARAFLTATAANGSGVFTRLSGSAAATFHLRPGIEIDSTGDLTVGVNTANANLGQRGWNLNPWRFTYTVKGSVFSEPGVLTLRAAGNLNVNSYSSISDGFSPASTEASKLMRDWTVLNAGNTWSYRIVAGADMSAADPLAVIKGSGNFNLSGTANLDDNAMIRTGNGTIQVAAGNNMNLLGAGSAIYTAGVPGPTVAGFTVPNFARFPTGGGDISISAGGSINAAQSDELVTGWLYRRGAVDINGNFTAKTATTAWWPRFDQFRQGIGALGGGDVNVSAGGDIVNLGAVVPTNGRLPGAIGTKPDISRLVEQGGGDLTVRAGGNIESGLFYVDQGRADIAAGGSIMAAPSAGVSALFAIGAGAMNVQAGRNIEVAAVFNPTVATPNPDNVSGTGRLARSSFFTYSPASSLQLIAGGAITLSNDTSAIRTAQGAIEGQLTKGQPPQSLSPLYSSSAISGNELDALALYPGTLSAAALNGDINVKNGFSLYPAANGNLQLLAGGSVIANGIINVSDAAPANLPQVASPTITFTNSIRNILVGTQAGVVGTAVHSQPALHALDDAPVRIYAAGGDVVEETRDQSGQLTQVRSGQFAKQTRIMAAMDIRDFSLFGQNVRANDVTQLKAGRDIIFTTLRDAAGNQIDNSGGIEVGGPGQLQVFAGRNIDLGNSSGIVTRGNLNNPFLPAQGASITAAAGTSAIAIPGSFAPDVPLTASPFQFTKADLGAYVRSVKGDPIITDEQARAVYNTLPADQQLSFFLRYFYLALRDTGRAAAQNSSGYTRGYDAIAAAFPGNNYQGDIKLFFSQIKTEQGGDINLLAPGGLVNAGLANPGKTVKEASKLGIITVNNGSIKAFVSHDFLVNQSRVFTLAGGDILIWSSDGSIDAGKGAKTASATPPPLLIIDSTGRITLDTTQSVAGSGIGVLLSKEGATPGDVDLIAPKGSVNAGDAGIRVAGNLTIASPRVIGADNIQVGGKASGVPITDSGGAGAASAASAASATSGSTRSTDDIARSIAAAAQNQKPAFGTSFITVEVLGLGDQ